MRYSKRTGAARFPVWSRGAVFNHGAGRWMKAIWARRVRRIHTAEIRRECETFTPIARIGSARDWL